MLRNAVSSGNISGTPSDWKSAAPAVMAAGTRFIRGSTHVAATAQTPGAMFGTVTEPSPVVMSKLLLSPTGCWVARSANVQDERLGQRDFGGGAGADVEVVRDPKAREHASGAGRFIAEPSPTAWPRLRATLPCRDHRPRRSDCPEADAMVECRRSGPGCGTGSRNSTCRAPRRR